MNKTALITGAAKRIGKALAHELHQDGFDIALHYRKSEKEAIAIHKALNSIRPNSVEIFKADLCKQNEVNTLIESVTKWRASLNVLINSASLYLTDNHAIDAWGEIFNCNVKAPYLLSHGLVALLKKENGCIINITDIEASKPSQNFTVYCMSKAALNTQTISLAKQFAPAVRVNALAPGAILWPENEVNFHQEIKQTLLAQTPLKKIGGTKPIIEAAKHFIENEFVTGAILPVDGGRGL